MEFLTLLQIFVVKFVTQLIELMLDVVVCELARSESLYAFDHWRKSLTLRNNHEPGGSPGPLGELSGFFLAHWRVLHDPCGRQDSDVQLILRLQRSWLSELLVLLQSQTLAVMVSQQL